MNKAVLITISCVIGSAGYGVELYSSDTETPEPAQNELTVTISDPALGGNDSPAVVAESLGIEDMDSIGVERLYWENDPDAEWRVFLDSKFMFRPDNYQVKFKAEQPEEKILTIDFKYWQNYDYGAGNYYPARDAFFVLDPDLLKESFKRFRVSFKAMPTYENSWKISYSLFERSGDSLSTTFGDDYQYMVRGIKSRNIVPSLSTGKETVQKVEFAFKRQEEVDRKGFRVHYQKRDSENTRVSERAASDPVANRYSRSEEDNSDNLWGFSAYSRKQLTDNIYGSIGTAYTRMDGDITGSRVFGSDPDAAYNIDFAASQLDDRGFLDLDSTRRLRQWVANANAVYDPEGDYRVMTGIRVETLSTDVFGSYLDTNDTYDFGELARQSQEASMVSANDKSLEDISLFLDIRYTGIAKAQLYTRIEVAEQEGDLSETWSSTELVPNPGSQINLLDRTTGWDRSLMFWETGVNYYPFTDLRISLEGYVKSRENEYDFDRLLTAADDWTSYPSYIEEQEFYTKDFNARVHWRALSWLKSVSRIDIQDTTIDSTPRSSVEVESSSRERMVFNQTLVVTPHPRFFLNASYQLVEDLTETPATGIGERHEGIIVNIPNDYWQVDVNVFYVLSKKIDLQLGYHYLEMENYLDTSPTTVPYGSDIKQHHGSLDFIFQISEATVGRLGYHYYEQTYLPMENRDYAVSLLKASLQRKF